MTIADSPAIWRRSHTFLGQFGDGIGLGRTRLATCIYFCPTSGNLLGVKDDLVLPSSRSPRGNKRYVSSRARPNPHQPALPRMREAGFLYEVVSPQSVKIA